MGYDSKAWRIAQAIEEADPDNDEPTEGPARLVGGLDPLGLDDPLAGLDAAELARQLRAGLY